MLALVVEILGLITCSLVDVIRKVEGDLIFNLYSRRRDNCRLDGDWNSANWDRGC